MSPSKSRLADICEFISVQRSWRHCSDLHVPSLSTFFVVFSVDPIFLLILFNTHCSHVGSADNKIWALVINVNANWWDKRLYLTHGWRLFEESSTFLLLFVLCSSPQQTVKLLWCVREMYGFCKIHGLLGTRLHHVALTREGKQRDGSG